MAWDKNLLSTLVEFSGETSIAGINNAGKQKSGLRSLVWLVIFLVFISLTGHNVYKIVTDYYRYPVITTTDMVDQTNILLPAITVCSLNRVNCHNAVKTLLTMKTSPSNTSGRPEVEREVGLLEMMLAENITNCLPTFCVGMKKRVDRHAILATI